MSTKNLPLLEIQLPEKGGSLRFQTLEEIGQWCTGEQQSLQFLRDAVGHDRSLANLWNRAAQFTGSIQQRFAEARRHASTPEAMTPHLNQIGAVAREFYAWSGFSPSAPRRKFLAELTKRNPLAAAYAFAYLAKQPAGIGTYEAMEGAIDAFLFSKGALDYGERTAAEAHFAALDQLRSEFASALERLRANVDQFNNEAQALAQSGREQFASHAEEFKNLCVAHEKGFDDELQAGQKQLADIAAAYDAKMALQAPVTYWEGQRDKYLKAAKGFAIAVFGWAACSLALIYIAAERLLTAASGEVISVAGLPIPKVPIWHFALLVVLLTFAFWFARILVRVLLSQIHLHTDASERVTMAKTYIALLREGQGPKDEDRQLILQTLFRPSATGIVKDDAIPPTVLEWITRLGSK